MTPDLSRMRAGLGLALVLLLAVLAVPAAAAAATFTVTKTADSNDGACTADCSLREALAAAEDAGGGDVVVPAGTYAATMMGSNAAWSPDETITVTGAGAGRTVLDANGHGRAFSVYGVLTVRGVTVTGGSPASGCACGGGFEVRDNASLTLESSVVTGNSATHGGGIDVDPSGRATLRNVVVTGNTVTDQGGGIRVEAPSNPTGGRLTLENVTIAGNTTTGGGNGGGLLNRGVTTGANVTVSGNATDGDGGGLYNTTNATLALNGATVAANTAADDGPGIANEGTADKVALRNSIVSGGAAPCVGGLTSHGHNIETGATCGFTAAGDRQSTDPGLGPLAADGVLVPTHALLAGSPAIDAGETAACPATDARGVARPQGPACDAGAYEVVVAPPAPVQTVLPVGAATPQRASGRARLTLLGATVTIRRSTSGTLRARCGNVADDTCVVKGKLTIKVPVGRRVRGKRRRTRTVTVGALAGTIAGGKTGTLTVTVTRQGRLRLSSGFRATITGTARNAAGAPTAFRGTVRVQRARRR